MDLKIIEGNLLDQDVEGIVNPWNRNFLPWWILLPQGVSGEIKKRAGYSPFIEVGKKGILSLGEAILTNSGNLNFKGIIHVAGINFFWKATENSIRLSTKNAILLASENNFRSIAFPLIGAGTGGFKKEKVLEIMKNEIEKLNFEMEVRLILFNE